MTRRLTHALAALYSLVALGLVHCAVASWQNASWPYAVFFLGAAICLTLATVHHSYQRDEIRYANARLSAIERAARPPADTSDAVVAVALAAACCEMWWTSAGAEHEPGCERHRSAA